MKTTIDLPDDLLIAAKKLAAERRTTIRSLVERGLRSAAGRGFAGSRSREGWRQVWMWPTGPG
jgi:ribosomal protein L15